MTAAVDPDGSSERLQLHGSNRDLGELFRTSPSAISNWKTRHEGDGFPSPLNPGERNARYDLDDVLDWARRPDTPARLKPNPAWWWRRTVEAARQQLLVSSWPGDVIDDDPVGSYLAAVVLVRAALVGAVDGVRGSRRMLDVLLAPDDVSRHLHEVAVHLEAQYSVLQGLLIDPLRAIEVSDPLLADLLHRLGHAADEGLAPRRHLEIVLESRAGKARRSSSTTDDELVTLVADQLRELPGGVLYDPCAGEGALVVECALAMRGPVSVAMQELDGDAMRIARTRCLLAGVRVVQWRADRSSVGEDQLPGLRADVIVADPPLSPRSPLVDWVDHVQAHLAPDGRAFIVLPVYALRDETTARRQQEDDLVRRMQALVAAGYVTVISVVPVRLRADVSGAITVWELTAAPVADPTVRVRQYVAAPTRTTAGNRVLRPSGWEETVFVRGEVGSIADVVAPAPEQQEVRQRAPAERAPRDAGPSTRDAVVRAFDDLAYELRPLLDGLRAEDRYDGDRVRHRLDEIRRLLAAWR